MENNEKKVKIVAMGKEREVTLDELVQMYCYVGMREDIAKQRAESDFRLYEAEEIRRKEAERIQELSPEDRLKEIDKRIYEIDSETIDWAFVNDDERKRLLEEREEIERKIASQKDGEER